jgi:hypothetical protein
VLLRSTTLTLVGGLCRKETMAAGLQKRQFAIVAMFFQVIFIILFAIFGRYSNDALPAGYNDGYGGNASTPHEDTHYVNTNYPRTAFHLIESAFTLQYSLFQSSKIFT